MPLQKITLSICLVLLVCAYAMAQTVTGSLVGTVVDPANSVVRGVQILLTNQGTAATSVTVTDNLGLFRFPNLNPATYSVTVEAKGFKKRIVTNIILGLSETRDLGHMTLDIGNVNDEITVTAEATPVQT